MVAEREKGIERMNNYYILGIFSVTIASFSQILLKKAAMKKYQTFLREYLNPYVIMGYMMMFCSVFFTMLAYRGIDFMSVPVLESIGYILVPILSYFFFKEELSLRKIIGIGFILTGVFIYYC